MGNARDTRQYAALKKNLEAAIALLETEDTGAEAEKVKLNLRYAAGAVMRLNLKPEAGDTMISLEEVCRFLQIRGEGLPEEECVRAVALPRPIFAQLERAAGMQDDLDQVQYALAGAITALPRDSKARGLLTAAAGAGKKLAAHFHLTPEIPEKQIDGARLRLGDACRAVEQVFRFVSAEDAARASGVPLTMVKQMDSAAASVGKREGWGDY